MCKTVLSLLVVVVGVCPAHGQDAVLWVASPWQQVLRNTRLAPSDRSSCPWRATSMNRCVLLFTPEPRNWATWQRKRAIWSVRRGKSTRTTFSSIASITCILRSPAEPPRRPPAGIQTR